MPRYYFHVDDGTRATRDRDGTLLDDHHAARAQALALLPAIACDAAQEDDFRVYSARVTDADGQPVVEAVLTLSVVWLTGGESGLAP